MKRFYSKFFYRYANTMRGYLSFLLLLVFLSAFIFLLNAYVQVRNTGSSLHLALAQKNYLALEVKHALFSFAAKGARDRLLEIARDAVSKGKTPTHLDMNEEMRTAAYDGLVKAASAQYDPSWELSFWCGPNDEATITATLAAMEQKKGALPCASCAPISSCRDFVDVDLPFASSTDLLSNLAPQDPSSSISSLVSPLGRIGLYGTNLHAGEVVGISMYNRAHNIAAIAYIPPNERKNI